MPRACLFRRSLNPILGATLACAALAACGGGKQSTAALLHVDAVSDERPFFVTFDWWDSSGVLLSGLRVPEGTDSLPATGTRLATIFVERDTRPAGLRYAIVRGARQDQAFWGALRVQLREDAWVEDTIVLQPGVMPDRDQDGMPDSLDTCPGAPDGAACAVDAGP